MLHILYKGIKKICHLLESVPLECHYSTIQQSHNTSTGIHTTGYVLVKVRMVSFRSQITTGLFHHTKCRNFTIFRKSPPLYNTNNEGHRLERPQQMDTFGQWWTQYLWLCGWNVSSLHHWCIPLQHHFMVATPPTVPASNLQHVMDNFNSMVYLVAAVENP